MEDSITAKFDDLSTFYDFEVQKYHIDDTNIYALILTSFGNKKFTSYSLL